MILSRKHRAILLHLLLEGPSTTQEIGDALYRHLVADTVSITSDHPHNRKEWASRHILKLYRAGLTYSAERESDGAIAAHLAERGRAEAERQEKAQC